MKTDQDFLELAVAEGQKGTAPHLYGALIVIGGEVVTIDHNHVWERSDPSAHAEVSTIVQACKKLGNHNLEGCTMYASHEPCLMCFSCAAWAKIDRIVFAHPASEADDFMYEFKDVNIFEMADKLIRPMKVELVRLK